MGNVEQQLAVKSYKVRAHVRYMKDNKSVWSAMVPVQERSKTLAKKKLPTLYYLDASTKEMYEYNSTVNMLMPKKSWMDWLAPLKNYKVKVHIRATADEKSLWSAYVTVMARNKKFAKKMLPKLYYLDASVDEMSVIKDGKIGRMSSRRG